MNFSSDNIELFLAVLDRGSFSAAARALRRVPSAVSMGIANMEAELGFALFDRSHREPTPTALALALAPHARLIAGQLKQLQVHAIELSQGLESTLSIGVASDINGAGLLVAVKTLSQRYPLLNIEVLSAPQDDVLHMLHQGRIGVCLAFGGLNINSAGAVPRRRRGVAGGDGIAAASGAGGRGGRAVSRGSDQRAADHGGQPRSADRRSAPAGGGGLLAHRQPADGAEHGGSGPGVGQFPAVAGRAAAGAGAADAAEIQNTRTSCDCRCI